MLAFTVLHCYFIIVTNKLVSGLVSAGLAESDLDPGVPRHSVMFPEKL